MSVQELAFMSITELASPLRRREISPVDVVKALLDRIDQLDGLLRAYITVCTEAALAAASTTARVDAQGPLYGIPIAHKDIFWTKGLRTTAHSHILEHFVPDENATSVARLEAAGTILLGKLNTHEMATGGMEWWGFARNPWHTGCVSGGSSSGSAVALAAHLTTAATGSDTGGSIRLPASLCGVAGLKPTYGRISRYGLIPLSPSLDHPGPMAKCVEDLAILLQVMAGPDPKDPTTLGQSVPDFRAGLREGVKELTLGVPRQHFFENISPETLESVQKAIRILEAEGARLTEVELPSVRLAPAVAYRILASAEAYACHRPWLQAQPYNYGAFARRRITVGAFFTLEEIDSARTFRGRIQAEFAAALTKVDALITPTTPFPAHPISAFTGFFEELSRLTRPVSLTGLPAVSIPCGFSEMGLPIGLQIIGRAWEEATMLRIAAAYEAMTDWHRRRPDPWRESPLPPMPAPSSTPLATDPGWVRAFAKTHDIPIVPEDVEPIAQMLAPIRKGLEELQ